MSDRINRAEYEMAEQALRIVVSQAKAQGAGPNPRDVIAAVLGAARRFRAQRVPIPAPLSLDLMAPEARPTVGDTVYVITEDTREVAEAIVTRRESERAEFRVKVAGVAHERRRWRGLEEVYPDTMNAHWALASEVEDVRMLDMEALIENERRRDEHLAAAEVAEGEATAAWRLNPLLA